MHRKNVLSLSLSLFFSLSFWGTSASAARTAVVTIEGAMVYQDASFDAPVIAYLKKGKKVRVSNKTYGAFLKLRVRRGKIGYISDIDVKVEGSGRKKRSADKGSDSEADKNSSKETDSSAKRDHALGLSGGMVNFKEEVLQQKVSAKTLVYGLKYTAPIGASFFDVNAVLSLSPPSYYESDSFGNGTGVSDPGTEPKGMFVLLDMALNFPIMSGYGNKWMLYIGGGPLIVYNNFDVTVSDEVLNLQDVKLGGSILSGFSFQLSRMLLKVEAKYFIEKNSYFGAVASIQKRF